MEAAVFMPHELTPLGFFYVIHRGVALHSGRVLLQGSAWGHDMILERQDLCLFAARAVTYLEVCKARHVLPSATHTHLSLSDFLQVNRLSRTFLLEAARPYPIAYKKIRWDAVRLALLRVLQQGGLPEIAEGGTPSTLCRTPTVGTSQSTPWFGGPANQTHRSHV